MKLLNKPWINTTNTISSKTFNYNKLVPTLSNYIIIIFNFKLYYFKQFLKEKIGTY